VSLAVGGHACRYAGKCLRIAGRIRGRRIAVVDALERSARITSRVVTAIGCREVERQVPEVAGRVAAAMAAR